MSCLVIIIIYFISVVIGDILCSLSNGKVIITCSENEQCRLTTKKSGNDEYWEFDSLSCRVDCKNESVLSFGVDYRSTCCSTPPCTWETVGNLILDLSPKRPPNQLSSTTTIVTTKTKNVPTSTGTITSRYSSSSTSQYSSSSTSQSTLRTPITDAYDVMDEEPVDYAFLLREYSIISRMGKSIVVLVITKTRSL